MAANLTREPPCATAPARYLLPGHPVCRPVLVRLQITDLEPGPLPSPKRSNPVRRPSISLTDDPAVRTVTWPDTGPCGTIQRIPGAARGRAGTYSWIPSAPDGITGPALANQHDAALWLRYHARPQLLEPPAPPADPVLELIRRHLDDGERDRADAAVIACIAVEIRRMREDRVNHTPPAVWHHLDRFATWLTALNSETAPAAKNARILEIVAATRR